MLIAMAVHDTVDNKRHELTSLTMDSLVRTVDLSRHRIFIINNGSTDPRTIRLLDDHELTDACRVPVIHNTTNRGTAIAINQAWKQRKPREHCVKIDNDVVIHYPDWATVMEQVFERVPGIGICGLKRRDLAEHPAHPDKKLQSSLHMLPHKKGEPWLVVEKCDHIMGTCEGVNSLLLDKIGYLYQMQDEGNLYGFDDSFLAFRSLAAGFINVFLCNIDIDHIDPGGTAYNQWKESSATAWMSRFNEIISEYKSGRRSLYWEDRAAE